MRSRRFALNDTRLDVLRRFSVGARESRRARSADDSRCDGSRSNRKRQVRRLPPTAWQQSPATGITAVNGTVTSAPPTTTNRLSKWTDGANSTIGDSAISEVNGLTVFGQNSSGQNAPFLPTVPTLHVVEAGSTGSKTPLVLADGSGYADNEWDDANTGCFSWAGGSNSTASGLYAFASVALRLT